MGEQGERCREIASTIGRERMCDIRFQAPPYTPDHPTPLHPHALLHVPHWAQTINLANGANEKRRGGAGQQGGETNTHLLISSLLPKFQHSHCNLKSGQNGTHLIMIQLLLLEFVLLDLAIATTCGVRAARGGVNRTTPRAVGEQWARCGDAGLFIDK